MSRRSLKLRTAALSGAAAVCGTVLMFTLVRAVLLLSSPAMLPPQ